MTAHTEDTLVERLKENADERRQFDNDAAMFTETGVLGCISHCLMIWHKTAPKGGSYREQLAIMSNEVAEAAARIRSLEGEVERLKVLYIEPTRRLERDLEHALQHLEKLARLCWTCGGTGEVEILSREEALNAGIAEPPTEPCMHCSEARAFLSRTKPEKAGV